MTYPATLSAHALFKSRAVTSVKIFDASWHMPDSGRNARAEYEARHIPEALYFDIDAISDSTSNLPHMLPDEAGFQQHMQTLGINTGDTVVFYDNSSLKSAARAWWMMRVMGHMNTQVLDGGLEAWLDAGYPVDDTVPNVASGDFTANCQPDLIRHVDQMLDNISGKQWVVVDARAAGRFCGTSPEPRAELASGHIPGARNVPFSNLYTPNGYLKPGDEIKRIFADAGVDIAANITTSCGSGVTACNLAHALYTVGNQTVAVYDGSWSEWGSRKDLPVATNH